MGLIRATAAAISGTMADQWKEFFYCESLPSDLLMVRGKQRVSANSSNTQSSGVITDGSVIAVADGQAAIVVSNGKIKAVTKEAGEFIYENPDAIPLYRKGGFKSTAKQIWGRIGYGGDIPVSMDRVYYMNTKPIMMNPFSTLNSGIPVRIVDRGIGLDIDCSLVAEGYYTFQITEPEITYKRLIGNVEHDYSVKAMKDTLQSEILSILQDVCKSISGKEIRMSSLGQLMPAVANEIRLVFNAKMQPLRGLSLVDISFNQFNLNGADGRLILQAQRDKMLCDPVYAQAYMRKARAEAMRIASGNDAGIKSK